MSAFFRPWRFLGLVMLLLTAYVPAAQAQHHHSHGGHHHSGGFGFGFSSYGSRYYGGGYYPGWSYGYPYSYGYGGIGPSLSLRLYSGSGYSRPYYSPSYVGSSYYYSSPNYVYTSPNYVVAPTTTVETRREIIVESPRPAEPTDGGPIVIQSPAENGETVNYTINGHSFTMKPGQSQKFANDRRWIIEFDQGAGRGQTKYTLNSGTFKFKQTSAGWDFVQTVEKPKLTDAPPPPVDTQVPLIVPTPN